MYKGWGLKARETMKREKRVEVLKLVDVTKRRACFRVFTNVQHTVIISHIVAQNIHDKARQSPGPFLHRL
jgi:hypothetical protein